MTHTSPLRAVPKLLRSDLVAILRDPALAAVIVMAVAPLVVFHFYAGNIDAFFLRVIGLREFTRLISPFVTTLPGLLIGWIFAMRVLEDRDSNLEPALMATPFGLVPFALLRMGVASAAAAAPVSAATAVVFGAPAQAAVLIGLCGGLQAFMVANLLPVLAANRVEGLAYSKFLSPFALLALIALVPTELRLVAVPLPTFHMGELLLHGSDLGRGVAALIVNLAGGGAAFLAFRRRAGRIAG